MSMRPMLTTTSDFATIPPTLKLTEMLEKFSVAVGAYR